MRVASMCRAWWISEAPKRRAELSMKPQLVHNNFALTVLAQSFTMPGISLTTWCGLQKSEKLGR